MIIPFLPTPPTYQSEPRNSGETTTPSSPQHPKKAEKETADPEDRAHPRTDSSSTSNRSLDSEQAEK